VVSAANSQANSPHVRKGRIADIDKGRDLAPEEGKKAAPKDRGRAELKAAFIEARAKGLSYTTIAADLRVSKSTLANWSQELEAEIASLKAMELEALYEQFYLLKEGRLRLLGEQLERIKVEAISRDLSEVSTDKLLDLLLKYHAELRDEFIEVRPISEAELAELKALG
jgi:ABC-type phosphate transport system auxiliary subunit